MPSITPYRFEIDYSGQSQDNYIVREEHTLITNKYRAVAPVSGAYFTESLQVFDTLTNNQLVRGADYKCLNISTVASAMAGSEVCALVLIINPQVSNRVHFNIQYVGGHYERSVSTLKPLLDNLTTDTRLVTYADIEGKPTNFEPSPHFVGVPNTIGYEYLVYELERIRQAILMGDDLSHDQLTVYITKCLDMVKLSIREMNLNLFQKSLLLSQQASTVALQTQLGCAVVNDKINAVLQQYQTLMRSAQQFISESATSEVLARDMMMNYPTFAAGAPTQSSPDVPKTATLSALNFPITDTQGIVGEAVFSLNSSGKILMDVSDASSVFVARMQLIKEYNTARAVMNLTLTSKADEQGFYTDGARITILPLQIGFSEKPIEVAAFDCNYLYSLLDPLVLPKYSTNPSELNPTTLMPDDLSGIASVARTIGLSLMDFRRDFNILGYGSVDKRSGVSVLLPKGAEITFTFKFNGNLIGDINKMVSQGIAFTSVIKSAAGDTVLTVDRAKKAISLSAGY